MKDELKDQQKLRKFSIALLLACALLGVASRFTGLNWDAGFHLHPDERFLCIVTPKLHWPASVNEYFDSSISPLNPFNAGTDFFVYGQVPLFIVKACATVLHRDDYNGILLVGRVLSALFDCGTILLLFLIGRRAMSTLSGLLAAAFYALMPLAIQQSHFWTVDSFAVFFVVASFWCLTYSVKLRTTSALCAGTFFGAALACKISSLLFLAVIVALALQTKERKKNLLNAAATLLMAFLVFRILHPIAFRGEGGVLTLWGALDLRPYAPFWNALSTQSAITSGKIDAPFNLQWANRTAYIWPLGNLAWAMGWPLLVCSIAGIALAARGVLSRKAISPVILCAALWVLVVFIFYGAQFSKFTRYYLPALPMAALCAAWFCRALWLRFRNTKWRAAPTAFTGGALIATLLWAVAFTSIYRHTHPRVAATNWILQNVPPGSVIANETAWDETLPLKGTERYSKIDLSLFDNDSREKTAQLLNKLDRAQWIFVSSPRVWKTIPRRPDRYSQTEKDYRALFDGSLGFEKVKEFSSWPQLLGYEIDDENFEEALHVYDHPRVMLFRKTAEYSHDKTKQILEKF